MHGWKLMDHHITHAAPSEARGEIQLLIVKCGEMRVAIPGRAIRGLYKTVEIAFRDTITLLGETYEKEDLVSRLDPSKTVVQFSSQGRTLLCSNGVWRKAYLVDRILGLVTIDPSHIFSLPPHFRGAEREWFNGLFFFHDAPVLIINLEWVLKPTDIVQSSSNLEASQAVDEFNSESGAGCLG